jgi:Stress responsive A/B Barrel Domain
MKSIVLTIVAAAITGALLFMNTRPVSAAEKPAGPAAAAPYRHVVLFKFKDNAPAEKVKAVVEAFKALKTKLPAIQSFEWGTNVSPEGLNQGLTHCFTLTFASKEALEKHYLHEPAHKEFGGMLKDILDKVLVVDYVAQ